ncbi:TN [Mytilus edulis]|uniref:TN n=1 Tax=Mytilus edulis TaxID=6550 RepID=A0A8S3QQ40_MYTED|nr:TN [Mytilus edulis]
METLFAFICTVGLVCCFDLEVKKQTFTVEENMIALPTNEHNLVTEKKVSSEIICASLCSENPTCYSASYHQITRECKLFSDSFPETETSEYGMLIRQPSEGEIPSVHIEKLNYSVSIGESVTLQCAVASSLTVTSVYWYKIVYGKIKILNSTSSGINGSSISNPSLTIINAALCDQGYYTCFATNILGVGQSANTSLSINGSTITLYPKDCSDLPMCADSGVYTISPISNYSVDVYCEMNIADGGWTARNENLHIITSNGRYSLRVELGDLEGNCSYADFNIFKVGDPNSKYTLEATDCTGPAGNSLISHNSQKFSTFDNDNDIDDRNCAVNVRGGWWYKSCFQSNLNGVYDPSQTKQE